ncbi:MAG: decaprenyl-phosphate phosphoribosyltransferase [Anaerolineales bacterium]|nr:decaprenyl-phosphate phosphoribosyltransferase [Anaerolineales bacterium]
MLINLLKTMRPKQWPKNVFIFTALVFVEELFTPAPLLKTIAAFFLFCLMSSAVYLINDVVDIEKDRQHPTKRLRPLPSGQLNPSVAIAAGALIPLVTLPLSFRLDFYFGLVALAYFLTMIVYSFILKNIMILDVLTIAAGFVLRAVAGAVVISVPISPWLYVCTTLVALFIGFSRRRHELVLLAENANQHRASLNEYSLPLLDQMIAVVTSATIIAYSLYTFSAPNLPPNHAMMLTIPFVLYGVFRYLYLIHVENKGGTPEEIFLSDLPIIIALGLWGLAVIAVLYFL